MTASMGITKTVEHEFAAFHQTPGAPSWSVCRRGHGPHWRVMLELACAPDELPSNGVLGDVAALRDFDTWARETLDHRLGARSLNDLVPDGSADALAHLVWEQWRERFPELRAVIVDESVGDTADWPQDASVAADRVRADKHHREQMRQADQDYWGLAQWDPALFESPLRGVLGSWAWHYKDCGRWVRSPDQAAAGPSWKPSWRETLADLVPDQAAADGLGERIEAWLEACRAFGEQLGNAGGVDDPAAREQVREARFQVRELSKSWMEPLVSLLIDESDRERMDRLRDQRRRVGFDG